MNAINYLLDVNLLLALCWEELEMHQAARTWFMGIRDTCGWATCDLTETAFVRLSMNPKLFPTPATFREAMGVLAALSQMPGHSRLVAAGAFSLSAAEELPVRGFRQVTDAYLLALAKENDAVLATFDRGLASLAKTPEWAGSLLLV